MKKIIFLAISFCLLGFVSSCTQNSYQMRATGLANNTDLVVKFNNKTGRTWVLIGRTWNLIVDNVQLPISNYTVWITSGTEGNAGGAYRLNQKTGLSWRAIDMVWVKLE